MDIRQKIASLSPQQQESLFNKVRQIRKLDTTAGTSETASPLVRLSDTGEQVKEPVFCVHPISGNVISLFSLAQEIQRRTQRNVYGLQAIHRPADEQRTVTEMAQEYIDAIKSVQPAGPYHIVGWSMGGFVAYEIGCQLAKLGEQLGLVCLLDTWFVACDGQGTGKKAVLLDVIETFVEDLELRHQFSVRANLHLATGISEEQQIAVLFDGLKAQRVLPDGMDLNSFQQVFGHFRRNYMAMAAYTPPTPTHPVLLVNNHGGIKINGFTPTLGWDQRIPPACLQVVTVAGDHYTMMTDPLVNELADTLTAHL